MNESSVNRNLQPVKSYFLPYVSMYFYHSHLFQKINKKWCICKQSNKGDKSAIDDDEEMMKSQGHVAPQKDKSSGGQTRAKKVNHHCQVLSIASHIICKLFLGTFHAFVFMTLLVHFFSKLGAP